MANGIVETEVKATLILTEEEAKYIKGLVQNPISNNETPFTASIRESIFHALKDIQL